MENINNSLLVAITLPVIGWIISLLLQRKNLKDQHRVQIRYDIYKEIVLVRKEVQNSIIKLGSHMSSPMILMEVSMIPFKLNLKKEVNGVFVPWSEQECLFEGEKKWNDFVQKSFSLYFEFSNNFLKLLAISEDWAAALEPLLPTQNILSREVERLKNEIHNSLSTLQAYATNNGHDWRNWNTTEIDLLLNKVNDASFTVSSYLHDFMVLIHNELLSSYFKFNRQTRKTLDSKFKVLVKGEIIENLDEDLIKKTEILKNDIINFAKRELQESNSDQCSVCLENIKISNLIISSICQECKSPLLILSSEKVNDIISFKYACGHGWQYQYNIKH